MSAALAASARTNAPRPPRSAISSTVGATALARILAHVADDDVGAFGGEAQRHRAAEARGAAGDDDRLSRETAHAAMVWPGRESA